MKEKFLYLKAQLLYRTLLFFQSLGFVANLTWACEHHVIFFDLVYNFAVKEDKKAVPGREKMIIGKVFIYLYPDMVRYGHFNFSPKNGAKASEKAFKDFKNSEALEFQVFQVGNAPDGSIHGLQCTEEEVLGLIFIYYWRRTIDLFTNYRSISSRSNSLNTRIGDSFERMVFYDVVFYQKTGLSFLNGIGRGFCNHFNIKPNDKVTYIQLPTMEDESQAPIKTDIILTVNGDREIKISAKCPQTYSKSKDISVLNTGKAGRSGFAETLCRGNRRVLAIFDWMNTNKLFDGLASVKKYTHRDDYKRFYVTSAKNYRRLVKLAVFGIGNSYAAEASSQADFLVEYCLQDGHSYMCDADVFCWALDRIPVEDLRQCFPLSGTSDHTARVAMNTPLLWDWFGKLNML